jgi:hypothetical protein
MTGGIALARRTNTEVGSMSGQASDTTTLLPGERSGRAPVVAVLLLSPVFWWVAGMTDWGVSLDFEACLDNEGCEAPYKAIRPWALRIMLTSMVGCAVLIGLLPWKNRGIRTIRWWAAAVHFSLLLLPTILLRSVPTPGEYGIELMGEVGSIGSPVMAGNTVRYDDGVQVAVGKPHRIPHVKDDLGRFPGDLTYAYTVTYVNDSDSTLELVWNGIDEEVTLPNGGAAFGVWDPNGPEGAWFPERLTPEERITVTMRINAPAGTPYLESRLRIADIYEPTYWKLPLD